jgi:hypothetical protein
MERKSPFFQYRTVVSSISFGYVYSLKSARDQTARAQAFAVFP